MTQSIRSDLQFTVSRRVAIRLLGGTAVASLAAACTAPAPSATVAPAPAAPTSAPVPTSAATAAPKPAAPTSAPAATTAPAPAPTTAPAAAKTAAPVAIKAAFPSLGGNLLALWSAKDSGIFEQNGLNADLPYVSGSPNTIAALIANEVQFAVVGASASVRSAVGGADVVLIATAAPGLAFRIYGRPEIKTIPDFKGKQFVQGGRGTDPDVAMSLVLKKYNMAESDLDFLRIDEGGDPSRFTTLQSSNAAGIIVQPGSFAKAEKSFGLHLVDDLIQEKIPYEQATVATRRATIKDQPDVVLRFVRSFTQSLKWVRDNRQAALDAMKKYSRNDDDAVLAETYDYYVGSVFPKAPYVSEEGVQTLLDLIADSTPAAKGRKAAEFIDNSFVKQVEDSGLIKQLYPA